MQTLFKSDAHALPAVKATFQIPYRYNVLTNRNYKVRILHFLNHLALIPLFKYGWSPLLIGSLAVYFFMFCIGVNVGVHRRFSHKSFHTSKVNDWFMGICMCLATLGSPFAWVGMHRAHHRYSDTPKDPHTPYLDSKTWTLKSFLGTYIGYWSTYHANLRNVRDIKNDKMHKFLHFYYLGVIFSYVAILAVINPVYVLYFYCLPAVLSFHAASMIVTLGHTFGKHDIPTRDHSRDNAFLHWVTFGEGLHNRHHGYPNAYYFKDTPWYLPDIPGFIIQHFFLTKPS